MSDLSMEFFYDSLGSPKWTVIVYVEHVEQFRVQGDTWEGILEDLTYSVPLHLRDQLSLTW